jgi:apolipoprotein D and lipocalin family protein
MKKFFFVLSLLFSTFAFAAHDKLPTPENVDIARYIGKWYAVSALPQFFTRKCIAQTAEYAIKSENSISVLNTCYKKNGKTTDIEGQAVIVDQKTNARLQVTFNNFFTKLFRVKGEYVIIKLSADYETVLVGSTNRKSLWILNRSPVIDPEVEKVYKSYAQSLGFPVSKMIDSRF